MHLKVKDVAEQLNLEPQTVAKWCRDGIIKAIDVRTPGTKRACWRIPKQSLEDFTRLREVRTPQPARTRRAATRPTQARFV